MRKIEFFITPEGRVMVEDTGKGIYEFTHKERDLCLYIRDIIKSQYPEAYEALCGLYEKSRPNIIHFDFLVVHRFIRCNFGKFDGLTYDIDDGIMHIEEVSCPVRCECQLANIICKPKPLGLSKREAEVTRMSVSGQTYDEISRTLGISHSTIKNIIQGVRKKLSLSSSKDIAKLLVTTL